MKIWVLTALMFALTAGWATTAVDAGPCAREKSRNCFDVPATINFSSVPEISNQIVNEEKIKEKPDANPTKDQPAATPYTGPMIGTSPLKSRTPTVGYYWSLE